MFFPAFLPLVLKYIFLTHTHICRERDLKHPIPDLTVGFPSSWNHQHHKSRLSDQDQSVADKRSANTSEFHKNRAWQSYVITTTSLHPRSHVSHVHMSREDHVSHMQSSCPPTAEHVSKKRTHLPPQALGHLAHTTYLSPSLSLITDRHPLPPEIPHEVSFATHAHSLPPTPPQLKFLPNNMLHLLLQSLHLPCPPNILQNITQIGIFKQTKKGSNS